jgi:hypothetical protein
VLLGRHKIVKSGHCLILILETTLERSTPYFFPDSVLAELNSPLEILSNLIYLASLESHDQLAVLAFMKTADNELRRLAQTVRKFSPARMPRQAASE